MWKNVRIYVLKIVLNSKLIILPVLSESSKSNEWVKDFSPNSTGYTWKNEVNDCTWRVLDTYAEKKIRDTSCAYEGIWHT